MAEPQRDVRRTVLQMVRLDGQGKIKVLTTIHPSLSGGCTKVNTCMQLADCITLQLLIMD